MVALVRGGSQFCGGTLVASKYVISAAHCMFDWNDAALAPSSFKVEEHKKAPETTKNYFSIQIRIGEHDLYTSGEGSLTEMDIDVAKYTNHENYNSGTTDNDITIIELSQEVDITTYTPACLAKTSDTTTFDGKTALVIGKNRLDQFI